MDDDHGREVEDEEDDDYEDSRSQQYSILTLGYINSSHSC